MAAAANVIHIIGGIAELISIIVCYNILETYPKAKIKRNRILLSLFAYIVITVTFIYLNGFYNRFVGLVMAILYTAKILLSLFIFYGTINKKMFYLTLFIDLSESFMSSCVSCLITNIFETVQDNILPFITSFIQIIALVVFLILKRKTDSKKALTVLRLIPERVYVLMILSIICLSAITSLVNFNSEDFKTKGSLLVVFIIVLSVILVCIVASLILNVISKQHFTVTSQMLEKQVEIQINYYKEIEKMDAEIRAFRHDYTNHLQSILSLLHMKEYSQAEEYIEKLQKAKHKFGSASFYSGNQLADAILANKCASLKEGFKIDYSGIIPSSIENTDLCIILSNLLDNAVEACEHVPAPGVISIFAGKQQGYFVLSIKNPTSSRDNFYDIPPTTKAEKGQHGMGLYNIESVVKKYSGQMKIKCENGTFELMITMKL